MSCSITICWRCRTLFLGFHQSCPSIALDGSQDHWPSAAATMGVVLSSVLVSRVKSNPLVQMLLAQMIAFVLVSLFSWIVPSGQLMTAASVLPPNFKVLSACVLLHKFVPTTVWSDCKSSDFLLQVCDWLLTPQIVDKLLNSYSRLRSFRAGASFEVEALRLWVDLCHFLSHLCPRKFYMLNIYLTYICIFLSKFIANILALIKIVASMMLPFVQSFWFVWSELGSHGARLCLVDCWWACAYDWVGLEIA